MKNIVLLLGRNLLPKFNDHITKINPSAVAIECSFEQDPPAEYPDQYLCIPKGKEKETILDFCKDKNVIGVINRKDYYEILHGKLVDALQIAGPSFHAVDQISNKVHLHRLMEELHLTLFRPKTIHCQLSEVARLLRAVQYPIIIKPFAGAHSRGVHKLTQASDFDNVYQHLYQHFNTEYATNMLGENDTTVLIEEHITGKQVAPVCYVDEKSKVHLLSLVRCTTAQDLALPHLQGIYRTTPSNFSEEVVNKIRFVLQKIARSTQLKSTFLDPEFIVHKNHVYLIEINVRLGGFREKLFKDAYNIDINRMITELSLRQEVDDSFEYVRSATACEIWEEKSGVVKTFTIPKSKHITYSQKSIRPGEFYEAPPVGNKPLGVIYVSTDQKSKKQMKLLREKVVVEFE